jgi:hypothetical protein
LSEDLERSRLLSAIVMRGGGVLMLAFSALVIASWRQQLMASNALVVETPAAAAAGIGLTLGPWLIVFGCANAPIPRAAPAWYRWGALLLALFGMGMMLSGIALRPLAAFLLQTR